ncbi:SS18 family [Sesbania bispinosa]|nr:SS18 family [Sesbania bispinosa]
MQQTPSMIPMMPSFPPTNITTEQIQKYFMLDTSPGLELLMIKDGLSIKKKQFSVGFSCISVDGGGYLDENKKLILAILDNQNLGKLAECAQYQAQLQKNLMYLAAIADAQPQTPSMPPQMAPHPAMQPGFYMQHPQAAAMAQQQGLFAQKMPLQFGNPHQMQDQQQQLHQQAIQGQMGLRPGGINNGMHPMHSEAALGGGSSGGPPSATGPNDGRGGSKQDASEAGGDGQGSSAAAHNSGDGEASYLKGSEEAK